MKKIAIFILIGILTITLGVITGINLNNKDKEEVVVSRNVISQTNRNENITSANQNNIENNIVENVIEDENEVAPKTDLERAKDIVEKAWGEDDNSVYFSQDSVDEDGYYIICVRDKETTSALAWYQVNVEAEVCVELVDW